MMNEKIKILLSVFSLLLFWQGFSQEKTQQYYIPKTHSVFSVSGTSSFLNWTMKTHEAKGDVSLLIEQGKIKHIHNLTVTIPAESLKSDRTALDRNAYKALKTKEYPLIVYRLKSFIDLTGNSSSLEAVGYLTLAGITKTISMRVTSRLKEGQVIFQGQAHLRMSAFDISPPRFLNGAFKAGDEVTIDFEVSFQENTDTVLTRQQKPRVYKGKLKS